MRQAKNLPLHTALPVGDNSSKTSAQFLDNRAGIHALGRADGRRRIGGRIGREQLHAQGLAAGREASASRAAFAIRFSRPIFSIYSSAACRLMINVVAGVYAVSPFRLVLTFLGKIEIEAGQFGLAKSVPRPFR